MLDPHGFPAPPVKAAAMKVLLLSLFCLMPLPAAEVRLQWDANPASDAVTCYEVSVAEVFGLRGATWQTPQASILISGLEVRKAYFFSVVAVSAVMRSEPSETLAYTVPQSHTLYMEESSDLVRWSPVPEVAPITIKSPAPVKFFRLRIQTP